MAIYTTYSSGSTSQKSNREDLTDMIYDISPTETPMLTAIPRTKATGTFHEWQTDALTTPSSTNAAVDGADSSDAALSGTSRYGNRTQIAVKSGKISGTQDAVLKAGKDSEYRYQVAKLGRELKTDMEYDICSNNAGVPGDASTARELAGYEAWFDTSVLAGASAANVSRASDGADSVITNGMPTTAATDGTGRTFTETLLKGVLQGCWTNGGNPDCIILGGAHKQVLSGFSGNATRFNSAEDGKLATSIDVYVSDFGTLKIMPNRFSRTTSVLVVQKDMWAAAYLRPMKVEKLAKVGDSERFQIVCEYTLEARNPNSSGIIADLS